jgi:hypothetical protein
MAGGISGYAYASKYPEPPMTKKAPLNPNTNSIVSPHDTRDTSFESLCTISELLTFLCWKYEAGLERIY